MKKWILGNIILIILVFIIWPNHDKKENTDDLREPISDLGYADTKGLTFHRDNFDGINNDNAITVIEEFYGLELNVPDTWKVDNVNANIEEMNSKAELTFSNVNDEDYNEYVETFYDDHHLGDEEISAFKNGQNYKWKVQIEGVSIHDDYTFEKENHKMIFTIEKFY